MKQHCCSSPGSRCGCDLRRWPCSPRSMGTRPRRRARRRPDATSLLLNKESWLRLGLASLANSAGSLLAGSTDRRSLAAAPVLAEWIEAAGVDRLRGGVGRADRLRGGVGCSNGIGEEEIAEGDRRERWGVSPRSLLQRRPPSST